MGTFYLSSMSASIRFVCSEVMSINNLKTLTINIIVSILANINNNQRYINLYNRMQNSYCMYKLIIIIIIKNINLKIKKLYQFPMYNFCTY